MKKIQLLLIVGLVVSAAALAACSKDEEGGEALKIPAAKQSEEIKLLAMVPENTQFAARFNSLEKLYEQFSVYDNSVMGHALKEEDIRDAKTLLGFNPFSIQEARQAGFDTESSFCLALTNMRANPADAKKNEFDALALLPVSDGPVALDTVRLSLENNDVLFVEAQKDGVDYIKWTENGKKGCFALRDQFLYMTINSKTDPQLFLESVLENKSSLTNSKAFRKIESSTDFTRDLVFYFNIKDIVETSRQQVTQAAAGRLPDAADASQMFESMRHYLAAAMTADLDSPDLSVNTVVALADGSEMKKIWKAGYVDRKKPLGITEPAVVLLSVGRDIKRYYKMVKEMMTPEQKTSVKDGMDDLKEETGIDMEADLLDNLSGSVNFGLYDGSSITILNYNALFTAGIKNEKTMRQLIDKAIKTLPPERQAMVSRQKVGKTDAYVLNAGVAQVYAGIDDNEFMLASGKPIFEKALDAEKNKGFAANLADKHLKNTMMGSRNIFYLNIDELVKTVNNFAMFLAESAGGPEKFKERLNAASRFEYVLVSAGLDDEIINSELTVKTRFTKPFFMGLAELIDNSGTKH